MIYERIKNTLDIILYYAIIIKFSESYLDQAMASFTLSVIVFFLAGYQSYSVMYIENNAYQNMVITIGEHVKEDQKLVNRIMEVFQNGSEFLYKVTRSGNIYYI